MTTVLITSAASSKADSEPILKVMLFSAKRETMLRRE
jgi:hypothetical protein